MKRVAVISTVICISWLVACGGPLPDETVGQRSQAVAGVQPVDALFGSVGTLMRGRSEALCPATLVGARTVLASGRCGARATHFVIFDGDRRARFQIETARVHPKHTPGQAAYDVALLRLGEQPAAVRPSALVTSAPRIGLGVEIPTPAPSAEDLERSRVPHSPLLSARVASLGPLLLQTSAGASDRSGTCQAPRGMPVFSDLGKGRRRVLVGLLSQAAGSSCGLMLRLDALLPWLTQASAGEIEILDTVAPTLSIDRPNDGDKLVDQVKVLAFAADDRELENVALRVDGDIVGVSDSGDVRFTLDLAPGVHVIELEARDRAGNSKLERVKVTVYGSGEPETRPSLKQIESNGLGERPGTRVTTVYGGCSAGGSMPADASLPLFALLLGLTVALRRR